jgi:hypothetical protein
MSRNLQPYYDLRPRLKTGDLLLFSGKGAVSGLIKRFTASKWSHVALVLRVPQFDSVFCWESTTLSNVPDVESGVCRKGVQLVGLRERLETYQGDSVVYRPLLGVLLNDQHLKTLAAFRSEVAGRPYEQSELELLRAAWDGVGGANKTADLSSLFCSELVAETYQRLGLLRNIPPSNEYTPADFAGDLPLLLGASLGQAVPLL